MPLGRSTRRACALAAALCALAAPAEAQYFGRNKVQYGPRDLRVLETAHFDIHHDARDEATVRLVGRMAERWHARFSALLHHTLSGRQAIVLYGEPSAFAHTNVVSPLLDESVGGVTEPVRRRIAMPLASTLAETDHVLGHEIAHAFQFDMARAHGLGRGMPAWFAEGLAEYLSLGSHDPLTRRWVLDAACAGRLPAIRGLAKARVSPYRLGHALWAHLVDRFGPDVVPRMLSSKPRDVHARLAAVTGESLDDLTAGWHRTAAERCDSSREHAGRTLRHETRLAVAPALSPDGRRVAYVAERDRLSIDVVLADAASGEVVRTLLRRAGSPSIESLQYVHSAASWSPDASLIVSAVVENGDPVLVFVDVETARITRRIRLAQFGQVLTPAWSPDGATVVFAGVRSGISDLFACDLATGHIRQLTDDPFTDVQPAWSPDGARLAWSTDRATTSMASLDFGALHVAVMDVATWQPVSLAPDRSAWTTSPQWSEDGRWVLAVSVRDGEPRPVAIDAGDSGDVRPIEEAPAIAALTATSPMLSVSRRGSRAAWSVLRGGRFELRLGTAPRIARDGGDAVRGPASTAAEADAETRPRVRGHAVDGALADMASGLADAAAFRSTPYASRLGFNALAQPYLAAGGSRLGSFVRGGVNLLFGDLTGDRVAAVALQAGSRLLDLGGEARWLDRRSRWHWGLTASFLPHARLRSDREILGAADKRQLRRTSELSVQRQSAAGAFLAWPFSRARRIEVGAGVRHIGVARERRSLVFAEGGRLLEDVRAELPSSPGVVLGEARVALVHDTTLFGGTGPVAGSRWRVEVTQHAGGLTFGSLTADYRKYFVPRQPVTLAVRLAHAGRYGRDATDARLFPLYVGARLPVRGYGSRTLTSRCAALSDAGCLAGDDLYGERLVAANVEARVPLARVLPATRRLRVPMDAFVFGDAAFAWGRRESWSPLGAQRVRSLGAGVRMNLLGLLLEIDAVRPLDRADGGWMFTTQARSGF